MDIGTRVRKGIGAKIVISIDLAAHGLKHIRVIAGSAEARDEAMAKVGTLLPFLEMLETAVQDERKPNER
jgi:hypothetical protein